MENTSASSMHEERVRTRLGHHREGGLQLVRTAHLHDVQVETQRSGCRGQVLQRDAAWFPGWPDSTARRHARSGARPPSGSPARFPGSSACRKLKPGDVPSGRARLATNPSCTGSLPPDITIGIVRVACWAARVAAVPPPQCTSTLSRTNSAARSGSRSALPSA